MASIKHLVDIDLNKNQITNVTLQHLSGNPSGSGEDYEGRIFYDSDANAIKFHNGTDFVAVGTSNATGDITAVTAGNGLTGGGSSGDVSLAVGVDDSSIEINSDALRVKATGITNAMLAGSIAASKLAGSIGDSKLSTISTANKVSLSALDIDGGTDIGAALVDADLMIVDDGANGTERKATMSRLKTYMQNNLTFISNTDTVDMGDGFVLEDGDGTEVTITENKEVKFVEGGGIDINWTDVDNGTDGDPYDLTFTVQTLNQNTTGSAATLTTARNIGGVSFNGSADIDLPGVNTGGNQDTSGNAATVTTNANLTGDVTSSGNATTIASGAVHHSMLAEDIISGQGALSSGLASTDEFMISDAGTIKKMDVSVLSGYLNDTSILTNLANVSGNSGNAAIYDNSGTPAFKSGITKAEVQSLLNITDGANVNTDVDVSVANLKTRLGSDLGGAAQIGDANDTVTVAGNLTVDGSITLKGDTVLESTTNTALKDKILLLNQGASGTPSSTADMGILWSRGSGTTNGAANMMFKWDESETQWQLIATDAVGTESGAVSDLAGTGGEGEDVLGESGFQHLRVGKLTSVTFHGNGGSLTDLSGSAITTGTVAAARVATLNQNTTGSAGTVTSIGNLTGDITSSNRATTIASGAVHHSMLNDDIISGQGAMTTVAQADLLMVDDGPGTVKKITFSDFEDEIFGNISTDITIAAGGAATIAADAVTYAKMQNVSATNVVLGRDSSGAGIVEEISASSLRTMLNVENGSTADQSKSDIDGLAITTVGTLDTGDATAIVSAASASAAGKVELATTAEALAGTDTARAVTPAGLAARSFKDTIGNGSATAITVNHALGTRDVLVQLYDASSYETLVAQVVRTDTANITVTFNSAPASNDVICLVTKID